VSALAQKMLYSRSLSLKHKHEEKYHELINPLSKIIYIYIYIYESV
jgi:hypothetical protein